MAACTGGTLLEIAALQDRADACIEWAAGCGFPFIEVSDGLDLLGPARTRELITRASRSVQVVAEVGAKDPEPRARRPRSGWRWPGPTSTPVPRG